MYKKIIIPQKIKGTGTIHDINSKHYKRIINFDKPYIFVAASHYGDYTKFFATEKEACRFGHETNYSGRFFENTGVEFTPDGDFIDAETDVTAPVFE